LTILERLARPFFAETRINMLNEDRLKRYSALGCHTLYVSVESGSDRMLKKIGKGMTGCGKTRLACHCEEPQATRNLALS
jgi:radical SAM superfamily enzyme YgiQ (UPF0313 family)